MAKVDHILAEVEHLVVTVRLQEAEEKLRSLMQTMGDEELRTWDADLRMTIGHFLPKRRKRLLVILDERVRNGSGKPAVTLLRAKEEPEPVQVDLTDLQVEFQEDLDILSDRHIYQWSTFYRDTLSQYFETFLDAARPEEQRDAALDALREPLESHSNEIFSKGFSYRAAKGENQQLSVTKSVNGLQRFLDLPIEFFSAKDMRVATSEARLLRAVSSAMLSAILRGYAQSGHGPLAGRKILAEQPRAWAHSLAFMSDNDLRPVLAAVEPGDFADGVNLTIRPLVQAFDELSTTVGDYVPLTALAQFNADTRRLTASIQPPPHAAEPQLIEVQCYLDSAYVSRTDLYEAANRNVGVVVARLRPDLRTLVEGSDRLKDLVIAAPDDELRLSAAKQRVRSRLEFSIYSRRSPRLGAQPLQYNFAREFPLQNPFLTRYFHVYRSSVRELLRTFERRNGVRLWCSVRRSGKTTACLDLGTTTGSSIIVPQTCETTGQLPGGSLFYDAVCDALAKGDQLRPTFFSDTVHAAATDRGSSEDRLVFVLDEYETLFGRLKSAVDRDQSLRYTVAQPLLNQMVAFTRDNLLVFLGQQPNAHFILMDQNQLSAYVEQDSFPLFEHESGSAGGELGELVQKVLTEQVSMDPSFVEGVYLETAGHPYLTVNLLTEFVDWLIERKRPVSSLSLDGGDIEKFAKQKLRPKQISLSPEYRFFREAIGEALSSDGRRQTPWLHAVYASIRGVVRASPETFRCTRDDFEQVVEKARLEEIGMDPDLLLATASQSNFLAYDEKFVWPKIRLLGRVTAVTRGRVTA